MTGPSLKGRGTPEDVWWGPGGLGTVPVRDPLAVRPPGRVVVVAPHPDDEVLGVGGSLAVWAAHGTPVLVVAVTDGEGSHPDSPTLAPAELAERRAEERRAALEVLGIEAVVDRLRLRDAAVAADDVAERLLAVLDPGDTVLVPVAGDGHPDHDATADGGAAAAARVGAACWRYPVWLWHWARPGEVALEGARRLPLPGTAVGAKGAAIDRFTTQVAPLSDDPRDAVVLSPEVLARFRRDVEIVWGPA
ncbi:PIG-L deacetylase family protein [Actinomycetospora straminea]|uniref:PIG-L family deacetylase n=1 Tax=Actinomycetospora straminea TaxID=663607 RepID=A0ABP9EDE6_9PSEU|nr:PIG-L family deacetylase [Actinomycetospora straminea]MDD7934392.1 PIG-L family deacetylase [Actinomycetospora straminea]